MIELIRTFPSYFVCQNSTSTLASDKEKCDKIIHIFPDICAQSRPNLNHSFTYLGNGVRILLSTVFFVLLDPFSSIIVSNVGIHEANIA